MIGNKQKIDLLTVSFRGHGASFKNTTFESATTKINDVRELIPEFYYFLEMFDNINNLDFGLVNLPKWSHLKSYNFVSTLRKAPENDKTNFNDWINLIFGSSQSGDKSIEVKNVFCNSSYSSGCIFSPLALKFICIDNFKKEYCIAIFNENNFKFIIKIKNLFKPQNLAPICPEKQKNTNCFLSGTISKKSLKSVILLLSEGNIIVQGGFGDGNIIIYYKGKDGQKSKELENKIDKSPIV